MNLLNTEDALLGNTTQIDLVEDVRGPGGVYCCMETCLANQKDFREEKPLLQIEVEKAGHLCLLLPKFHCELNPIEMYWGYGKQREPHPVRTARTPTHNVSAAGFRQRCNGTFPTAKILVPECLDACSVLTIRHFFRKSWRYCDAYRKGLTGKLAEHAIKKFASHRKIGPQIMMAVDMLLN